MEDRERWELEKRKMLEFSRLDWAILLNLVLFIGWVIAILKRRRWIREEGSSTGTTSFFFWLDRRLDDQFTLHFERNPSKIRRPWGSSLLTYTSFNLSFIYAFSVIPTHFLFSSPLPPQSARPSLRSFLKAVSLRIPLNSVFKLFESQVTFPQMRDYPPFLWLSSIILLGIRAGAENLALPR